MGEREDTPTTPVRMQRSLMIDVREVRAGRREGESRVGAVLGPCRSAPTRAPAALIRTPSGTRYAGQGLATHLDSGEGT